MVLVSVIVVDILHIPVDSDRAGDIRYGDCIIVNCQSDEPSPHNLNQWMGCERRWVEQTDFLRRDQTGATWRDHGYRLLPAVKPQLWLAVE